MDRIAIHATPNGTKISINGKQVNPAEAVLTMTPTGVVLNLVMGNIDVIATGDVTVESDSQGTET